jgi:hypothetical protein
VRAPHAGNFKIGNPGGPGRPKGGRNRIQNELANAILAATAEVGFIGKAEGRELPRALLNFAKRALP